MDFLFASILCLGLFSQAAESLPAAENAASHKELLKKMNLKSFESLKGRFVQVKILSELEVQIKTEGNFLVNRKDPKASVFNWNVEKPSKSQVCLDSKGVVLDSGGKKKKISFSEIGQDSGQQMTSLLKLMSLDPGQLDEDFHIKPAGEDYLLTPKKPESVFFQTALIHVSSAGIVDKISVKEKSGDELNIQFSNLKTEKAKDSKACVL